jgi:hypothetical protein
MTADLRMYGAQACTAERWGSTGCARTKKTMAVDKDNQAAEMWKDARKDDAMKTGGLHKNGETKLIRTLIKDL